VRRQLAMTWRVLDAMEAHVAVLNGTREIVHMNAVGGTPAAMGVRTQPHGRRRQSIPHLYHHGRPGGKGRSCGSGGDAARIAWHPAVFSLRLPLPRPGLPAVVPSPRRADCGRSGWPRHRPPTTPIKQAELVQAGARSALRPPHRLKPSDIRPTTSARPMTTAFSATAGEPPPPIAFQSPSR
jgi:hypothetical protein